MQYSEPSNFLEQAVRIWTVLFRVTRSTDLNNIEQTALQTSAAFLYGVLVVICILPDTLSAWNRVEVNARTWATMHGSEQFPEMHGEYAIPHLKDRPSFGIAISGGGTRSASAAVGQLRAMESMGWIDQARYVSAVSGGSWAAVPYFYAERKHDVPFLGTYTPPELINESTLKKKPPRQTLAHTISSIGIISPQLVQIWRGNEAYGHIIGKNFLTSLDIDRKKFFTYDTNALEVVMSHQSSADLSDLFITIDDHQQLPYLIVGATALPYTTGDKGRIGGSIEKIYPVEITPIYTGSRAYDGNIGFGGGYIESFAYDAYQRSVPFVLGKQRLRYSIKNKNSRFTLADMVGTSGSAPVALLERTPFLPNFPFPKYNYQQLRADDEPARILKDVVHGDGGHIDNLGVMSLLAREVENILVLINSSTDFDNQRSTDSVDAVSEDLSDYFGQTQVSMPEHPFNNVIVNGSVEFDELIRHYTDLKKAGQPLVHCDRYQISNQQRYGLQVSSSYRPNICWIYLDRAQAWIDQVSIHDDKLHRDQKNIMQLKAGTSEFKRFPHFSTFFDTKLQGQVIDLDAPQINAIGLLTHWTLLTSQMTISSWLNLDTH